MTEKVDPRFASFARLLPRHAARQDFKKELSPEPDGDYDSHSVSEE